MFCLIGSFFIFTFSCGENIETELQLEKVLYELGGGKVKVVYLDPNKVHSSHSFNSLEDHDEYLVQLETSTERLVINKRMYEDLSHYFDPIQLSVLDQDYSISIGDTVFRATKEAIDFKINGEEGWRRHIYYGLTGDEDLKETELVHKNIENLTAIESYEFKSPLSEKLFQNLRQQKSLNARVTGKTENWYNWLSDGVQPYIFKYRQYYNGPVQNLNIRWYCWHETYSSWGAKTKGGTVTQWKYDYNPGGWTSMSGSDPLGPYHEANFADVSIPYTWVELRVNGEDKRKGAYAWSVSLDGVKRKSGTDAQSRHIGDIRPNNSNTSVRVMSYYFLE